MYNIVVRCAEYVSVGRCEGLMRETAGRLGILLCAFLTCAEERNNNNKFIDNLTYITYYNIHKQIEDRISSLIIHIYKSYIESHRFLSSTCTYFEFDCKGIILSCITIRCMYNIYCYHQYLRLRIILYYVILCTLYIVALWPERGVPPLTVGLPYTYITAHCCRDSVVFYYSFRALFLFFILDVFITFW